MEEIRMSKERFSEWVVAEIMKAKAKWLHACYAAILPPALYDLAKLDNEMDRVTAWTKAQGYSVREFKGESRLYKGEEPVAVFKPELRGEGDDRHMGFYCEIFGKRVDLGGKIIVLTK